MKKILLAGACALALSATGALAQTNEGQGGAPSAKSGGTTMSPGGERQMKKEHKTTGSATHKSGAKPRTGGQGTSEGGGGSRY
ncbi:Spy/CpxP family protein refolding chaperone [Nitrobacteraceae bacterium AZCC 1564]